MGNATSRKCVKVKFSFQSPFDSLVALTLWNTKQFVPQRTHSASPSQTSNG
jgi:hypothetical protein